MNLEIKMHQNQPLQINKKNPQSRQKNQLIVLMMMLACKPNQIGVSFILVLTLLTITAMMISGRPICKNVVPLPVRCVYLKIQQREQKMTLKEKTRTKQLQQLQKTMQKLQVQKKSSITKK